MKRALDREQGRRGQKPSVLFINRVYPPLGGATGEVLAELATGLVEQGWSVSVLTSALPGHHGSTEVKSGVRVERVRVRGFKRSRLWERALAYLLLYPSLLWRTLRLRPADVVVTKTDPPMLLVLGAFLKKRWGCRVVHWAQDLYPEVAEELGVIRQQGRRARVLREVSNKALRAHDEVVAIGRCMYERLQQRGVPAEKMTVIPNWPARAICSIKPADNPFRAEQGLEDRFVVMYSGNMGKVHAFEVMLEAAAVLQRTAPEVLFLFVGEGPRQGWLQEETQRLRLDNVRFLPFQEKSRLAYSLSAADLHLVSMLETVCGLVVPSKVYGVLAAGRPCLFLGPKESEAAHLLREHNCGQVLEQATGCQLADCIDTWRCDEARRKAAGEAAQGAIRYAGVRALLGFEAVLRGQRQPAEQRIFRPAAPATA